MDLGLLFRQRHAQVLHHFLDHAAEGERGAFGLAADARIGQQVVEQGVHAGGAFRGAGDEMPTLGGESSTMPTQQEVEILGDGPQWLLQVMRTDVDELLQLGVRPDQVLGAMGGHLLGLALGLEQAGAVHGDGGLGGDAEDQPFVIRGEAVGQVVTEHHPAQHHATA